MRRNRVRDDRRVHGHGLGRASTIANSLPHRLKVRDGHQSTRAVQRIAGLIPVGIVFAPHYVQEVALREAQVPCGVVGVGRGIVVEGLDNLRRVVSGARGVLRRTPRLTFLGGIIASAALGGIEMWCGRESFSPFIERRNCDGR